MDRKELQQQAAEDHRKQAQAFQTILETEHIDFKAMVDRLENAYNLSRDKFTTTINGVNTVLRSTQTIAAVTKTGLEAAAGEGSYPCVEPDAMAMTENSIPLQIWNMGKTNNLTGVSVSIVRQNEYVKARTAGEVHRIEIGTLPPGWPKALDAIHPRLDSDGMDSYHVEITSQRGLFTESLEIRRNRKHPLEWAHLLIAEEQIFLSKPSKRFPEVVPNGSPVGALLEGCSSHGWTDEQ